MATAPEPAGRERPITEDVARALGLHSSYVGGIIVLPECPTCEAVIEGYGMHRDVIEVPDYEELWPGGPFVAVPTMFPRLKPTPALWWANPCGHLVDVSDLRIEARTPCG